jgi:hypothetical protein
MQRENQIYKTSFIIAVLRMRNQCEILPSLCSGCCAIGLCLQNDTRSEACPRCAWEAALRISTFLSS